MADNDIRDLEQKLKASPEDAALKARLRLAYVRAERPAMAKPILKGDKILVIEDDNNWINTPWEGLVTEALTDGDLNVKPLNAEQDWRVKPAPEYLAAGLYIADTDVAKCIILQPVMPE